MATAARSLPSGTGRRKATKEFRRQQLIQATIKCVAKRGFSDTTMADVTREAGLSLGIVNLHFQSKDKLFIETLRFLSEEYEAACRAAMEKAGPSPAMRLSALVDLDFSARVTDRRKLAVWFAFWGEARSRPTYMQLCADKDRRYELIVTDLCQRIIDDGGYEGVEAAEIAQGLSAMVNGLWLDMLMTPDEMPRDRARHICRNYLARAFPAHFKAA
jgi:TetR/AcrR family transcriptional repressor of bet genes